MLPERYLVHVNTNEESIKVSNYAREKYNPLRTKPYPAFDPKDWPYHEVNYQESNEHFNIWNTLTSGRDKLPLFEFEEWERLLNEENKPNMSEKKIIGYIAPKDLFAGNVKKGTIYKTTDLAVNYYPEHLAESSDSSFNLPYEIVEDWEPVYKKSYKVGDNIIWVKDYDERGKSWFVKGDVAEITHVGDNFVQMYSPKEKSVGGFSIDNENFRIATPEEIIEAKLPKEGDFIYIIRTGGNIDYTKKDTVYKVSSIKKPYLNWDAELVDEAGNKATYRLHGDNDTYGYIDQWRKATPEEIENFSKIEFLGYTLEINEEYAKFGCQYFTKEQVTSLLNFTERTAFNAEVRINDTVVKPEFLSKILAKMADYENS